MGLKKKILIVDDEEDFCFLIKKNLESTGEFEVFVAYNGIDGFCLARVEKPDLILLDIIMPDIGGSDVVHRLKADEHTKNIPVIFLTAVITPKETGKGRVRKIGSYNYIAKPIDTDRLIAYINDTLAGKDITSAE
ncbi:MAG: response regulator [Candidatus Omnitrophica bacterium]|nr:response regulator [Candidatus Omnitrophota bacterium]MBU1924394.1 response regulator [Candidatus Omnitrophota bacterium]